MRATSFLTVVSEGRWKLAFMYLKSLARPGDSPVSQDRSSSRSQAAKRRRKPRWVGMIDGLSAPSFRYPSIMRALAALKPCLSRSPAAGGSSSSSSSISIRDLRFSGGCAFRCVARLPRFGLRSSFAHSRTPSVRGKVRSLAKHVSTFRLPCKNHDSHVARQASKCPTFSKSRVSHGLRFGEEGSRFILRTAATSCRSLFLNGLLHLDLTFCAEAVRFGSRCDFGFFRSIRSTLIFRLVNKRSRLSGINTAPRYRQRFSTSLTSCGALISYASSALYPCLRQRWHSRADHGYAGFAIQ